MKISKKNHPLTQPLFPSDYFDKLNYLKEGKGTDRLITLITRNVVQCGIRVYRIMRDIEREILPITQRDLTKASRDLDLTTDHLRRLITVDPKISRRIMYGDLTKPEAHRPPDFPLHILIIYMREHLKKVRVRPNNNLICEFLFEQKIKDNISPDRISKIARTDLKILKNIYNFFLEIYETHVISYTSLEDIITFVKETRRLSVNPSADNPMGDIGFPIWEDFMP